MFFATRDALSRSHVAWADIDLERGVVLAAADAPSLAPGPLGCFDDHGVYPSSVVEDEDRLLLFYVGWNPGKEPPLFYSSIGLATSVDGGVTFERMSTSPILARSVHDPCLVTSPWVLREGPLWRMWYVSGFRWEKSRDGIHSWYHVKYAESKDGRTWNREGHVAIELAGAERNIARPCVLADERGYRMWYSHDAGGGYRIGYAESSDGYAWQRLDDRAGIERSPSGWDSEAQAYPWVVRGSDRLYMLYNGNRYGADGFGLAERSS